MNYLLIYYARG